MDNGNMLVFYSNTDVKGRKDATGAFVPEAKAFAKLHGVPDENLIGVRCPRVSKQKRREAVISKLNEQHWDALSAVAFFGHGWPKGIQFGFDREHIGELVNALMPCCRDDAKIILFACLAAENDVRDSDIGNLGPGTDGGFADLLRDQMVRVGMNKGWVDAHKTAGHTSWNPYLVRFLCEDVDDPEYGAEGGAWIVEPRSRLWKKWVQMLRQKKGGLRYRFPFMDELEIKQELAA